jgi:hypothetical protein
MKKMKNQKGQALIELIVFLPLMITLYSVIGGLASSINGSINQQKVTRAYFYYRVQNNSTIPGPKSGDWTTWKKFGMFFIGWKDYFQNGDTPVMPCYKISIPFKDVPADKCEDSYTETKTLWVRVGTVYGVCGGTYFFQGTTQVSLAPDYPGLQMEEVIDRSSCLISQ